MGALCRCSEFARIPKDTNITIVHIGDNHSFDAGKRGFIERTNIRKDHNGRFVGGGASIEEARHGKVTELRKLKLDSSGRIAYCNRLFVSVAKCGQPRILPLFEPVILDYTDVI